MPNPYDMFNQQQDLVDITQPQIPTIQSEEDISTQPTSATMNLEKVQNNTVGDVIAQGLLLGKNLKEIKAKLEPILGKETTQRALDEMQPFVLKNGKLDITKYIAKDFSIDTSNELGQIFADGVEVFKGDVPKTLEKMLKISSKIEKLTGKSFDDIIEYVEAQNERYQQFMKQQGIYDSYDVRKAINDAYQIQDILEKYRDEFRDRMLAEGGGDMVSQIFDKQLANNIVKDMILNDRNLIVKNNQLFYEKGGIFYELNMDDFSGKGFLNDLIRHKYEYSFATMGAAGGVALGAPVAPETFGGSSIVLGWLGEMIGTQIGSVLDYLSAASRVNKEVKKQDIINYLNAANREMAVSAVLNPLIAKTAKGAGAVLKYPAKKAVTIFKDLFRDGSPAVHKYLRENVGISVEEMKQNVLKVNELLETPLNPNNEADQVIATLYTNPTTRNIAVQAVSGSTKAGQSIRNFVMNLSNQVANVLGKEPEPHFMFSAIRELEDKAQEAYRGMVIYFDTVYPKKPMPDELSNMVKTVKEMQQWVVDTSLSQTTPAQANAYSMFITNVGKIQDGKVAISDLLLLQRNLNTIANDPLVKNMPTELQKAFDPLKDKMKSIILKRITENKDKELYIGILKQYSESKKFAENSITKALTGGNKTKTNEQVLDVIFNEIKAANPDVDYVLSQVGKETREKIENGLLHRLYQRNLVSASGNIKILDFAAYKEDMKAALPFFRTKHAQAIAQRISGLQDAFSNLQLFFNRANDVYIKEPNVMGTSISSRFNAMMAGFELDYLMSKVPIFMQHMPLSGLFFKATEASPLLRGITDSLYEKSIKTHAERILRKAIEERWQPVKLFANLATAEGIDKNLKEGALDMLKRYAAAAVRYREAAELKQEQAGRYNSVMNAVKERELGISQYMPKTDNTPLLPQSPSSGVTPPFFKDTNGITQIFNEKEAKLYLKLEQEAAEKALSLDEEISRIFKTGNFRNLNETIEKVTKLIEEKTGRKITPQEQVKLLPYWNTLYADSKGNIAPYKASIISKSATEGVTESDVDIVKKSVKNATKNDVFKTETERVAFTPEGHSALGYAKGLSATDTRYARRKTHNGMIIHENAGQGYETRVIKGVYEKNYFDGFPLTKKYAEQITKALKAGEEAPPEALEKLEQAIEFLKNNPNFEPFQEYKNEAEQMFAKGGVGIVFALNISMEERDDGGYDIDPKTFVLALGGSTAAIKLLTSKSPLVRKLVAKALNAGKSVTKTMSEALPHAPIAVKQKVEKYLSKEVFKLREIKDERALKNVILHKADELGIEKEKLAKMIKDRICNGL